eukprot:scaffold48_cov311-Pinguiococcus_pyrenoidosus.AAC.3
MGARRPQLPIELSLGPAEGQAPVLEMIFDAVLQTDADPDQRTAMAEAARELIQGIAAGWGQLLADAAPAA